MTAQRREREERPSSGLEAPPRPPDEFKLCGVDEKGSPYERVKELCAEFGIPTSLISGAHTRLRSASFHVELTGGNAHGWRRRLLEAQRKGPLGTKEAGLLGPMCDVASAWPGPDQVTLAKRRDDAAAKLAEARARLEPYRENRLASPPELERAVLAAEKALQAAEAAFNGGRVILEGLAKREASARRSLNDALVAALQLAAGKLGEQAKALIPALEVDYYVEFPHRVPPEVDSIWRNLQRVDALVVEAGGQGGAWPAFASGCGQAVAEVVAELFNVPVETAVA